MATQTAVKTNTKTPKKIEPPKSTRSKVSKGEWWLVVGILGFIDGAQIVLDAYLVGVGVNRFIDILVALSLFFFLLLKGELSDSSTRTRVLAVLIISFLGEEVPVLDAAPFWIGDGFYFRHQSIKRNERYEEERRQYLEDRQKQLNAIEIRQKIEAFKAKRAENDIIQDDEDEQ